MGVMFQRIADLCLTERFRVASLMKVKLHLNVQKGKGLIHRHEASRIQGAMLSFCLQHRKVCIL
ncbi:UNVERIFIED_CONTAM: hypothetical protein FKN15_048507 [Acipenser sinensis]